MNGRLRELEVAVSVCASFEDVLVAERILTGIVGPHVRLRSFQAGTAILAVRIPEAEIPFLQNALRGPCGRLFSVSETRHGRIELWSREPVTPGAAAVGLHETATAPLHLPALRGRLPVRGLTPG